MSNRTTVMIDAARRHGVGVAVLGPPVALRRRPPQPVGVQGGLQRPANLAEDGLLWRQADGVAAAGEQDTEGEAGRSGEGRRPRGRRHGDEPFASTRRCKQVAGDAAFVRCTASGRPGRREPRSATGFGGVLQHGLAGDSRTTGSEADGALGGGFLDPSFDAGGLPHLDLDGGSGVAGAERDEQICGAPEGGIVAGAGDPPPRVRRGPAVRACRQQTRSRGGVPFFAALPSFAVRLRLLATRHRNTGGNLVLLLGARRRPDQGVKS